MSNDLVIQLGQEALMMVMIISGTNISLYSQNYCSFRINSDFWTLDASDDDFVYTKLIY